MERVYDGMGDRLAMRHHLDRYDELTGGPSARGLDDEVLRRMASYLLSLADGRWRRLAKSIPALWKRGGREHRKLAGMLLANLPEEALGDQRWTVFSTLLQDDVGLAPVVDAPKKSDAPRARAQANRGCSPWRLKRLCGTATRPSSR